MAWVERAPGSGSWGERTPSSATRTATHTINYYSRLITDGYGLNFTAATLGVDGYDASYSVTTTVTVAQWGERAPSNATWTAR